MIGQHAQLLTNLKNTSITIGDIGSKLDTETEQSIAARWSIRSIPTLILLINDKEVARTSGVMPLGQLKCWLKQHSVNV